MMANASINEDAKSGNLELVKSLIESGADPLIDDFSEGCPLYNAAKFGHLAVLEYLCSFIKNDKSYTFPLFSLSVKS